MNTATLASEENPGIARDLVTGFIPSNENAVWRKMYLASGDGTVDGLLRRTKGVSRDQLASVGLRPDQWTYLEALNQWADHDVPVDLGLAVWHLRSAASGQQHGLRRHHGRDDLSIGASIRYLQIVGQIVDDPIEHDPIAGSCLRHIENAQTSEGAVKATGGIPDVGTTARALKALALCKRADENAAQQAKRYLLSKFVRDPHSGGAGWSAAPDGAPVTGATALAVDAIVHSSMPAEVREGGLVPSAVGWLLDRQHNDGGWSEADGGLAPVSHVDVTFWTVRALASGEDYCDHRDRLSDCFDRAQKYACASGARLLQRRDLSNELLFALRLCTLLDVNPGELPSRHERKLSVICDSPETDLYAMVAVKGLLEVERRRVTGTDPVHGRLSGTSAGSLLRTSQPQFLQADPSFYDFVCRRTRRRWVVGLLGFSARWHIAELVLGVVLGAFLALVTLAPNLADILGADFGIFVVYGIVGFAVVVTLFDLVVVIPQRVGVGLLRLAVSTAVGAVIAVASLQAYEIPIRSLLGVTVILLGSTIVNLAGISSDQLSVLSQVAVVLERLEKSRATR